jgi:glycosyltransferase involved in cell wall biosynthesis
MKVLTTHEFHYLQYEDGFYDPRNYTGSLYNNLAGVFEEVIIIGRSKKVKEKPDCQRIDGDNIKFFSVPDFNGYYNFWGMVKAWWKCRKATSLADRYWLRTPGFISGMVAFWLRRAGIPYYIWLVGDPAEVAKTKAMRFPSPFSKIIPELVRKRFRYVAGSSCGVMANTFTILQKRYPSSIPQNDTFAIAIDLPAGIFSFTKRDFSAEIFKIVIVGVLLKYKGHDYLLEALARIKNQRKWSLLCIGQGPEKKRLEAKAKTLGIGNEVEFCGRIDWGDKLFKKLDESHLFVLSSLTEGLPSVMLEAMARALPVVATDVGGISEVLEPQFIVPPKNANALAEKICSVWNNPELLSKTSQKNYDKAKEFEMDRTRILSQAWFRWLKEYGQQPKKHHFADYAKQNLSEEYLKSLELLWKSK